MCSMSEFVVGCFTGRKINAVKKNGSMGIGLTREAVEDLISKALENRPMKTEFFFDHLNKSNSRLSLFIP